MYIRNSAGERMPPCITPLPTCIWLLLVAILVCWYSHSIVLIRSSSISYFLSFSSSFLWFTLSNADFRSINNEYTFSFLFFVFFSWVSSSLYLRSPTSHPTPSWNPSWVIFILCRMPSFSCSFSLLSSIISSSLYTGEVFVIGLELSKFGNSGEFFGKYIYSRMF